MNRCHYFLVSVAVQLFPNGSLKQKYINLNSLIEEIGNRPSNNTINNSFYK